jgi:hypothetical protein
MIKIQKFLAGDLIGLDSLVLEILIRNKRSLVEAYLVSTCHNQDFVYMEYQLK